MEQRRRRKKKKRGCLWTIFWLLFIILAAEIALGLGTGTIPLKSRLQDKAMEYLSPEIPYQEVSLGEEEIGKKYYYELLPEEEKTVYREILGGIKEYSPEIYLHSADAKRTNEIYKDVLMDNPEIFWCDGTGKTTSYEGKEKYNVLEPQYTCTAEEKEQRQQEIEAAAGECLAGIKADASDYDKILYVFEYIVNTVDYDLGAEDNQNIYSVFAHRRSVCAGYSKATQYLLERLGGVCTYVPGVARGGESHAWNLVLCEGDYYYVDTTWGDPVFLNSEQAEGNDNISYDYMLCNDGELFKTHRPDADIKLPECTKMDWNYYVVNNLYYKEYDSDTALKEMNRTITDKGECTVFKYADPDSYEQAHKDIFGNLIQRAAQNLASLYGLKNVRYTYMDDPDLNKIVIFWQYK